MRLHINEEVDIIVVESYKMLEIVESVDKIVERIAKNSKIKK